MTDPWLDLPSPAEGLNAATHAAREARERVRAAAMRIVFAASHAWGLGGDGTVVTAPTLGAPADVEAAVEALKGRGWKAELAAGFVRVRFAPPGSP